MKIWYDACTGKHVRYGVAIAKRLRKRGHEVIFTTRNHPDTVSLARILGDNPVVVGNYNPASLFTRLEEGANRIVEFSRMFRDHPPEAAICHQSVELCRFAFGINIPLIVTADTPHAVAVNRLTIPLASTVLISEAIPRHLYRRFGVQEIQQFKGVDEVAWIKGFCPLKTFDFKRPLIVVRQMESRSAYALGKSDVTADVARKLSALGTVVFLPRYSKPRNVKLTVLDGFVDSASLAAQADLVASVGGTIAREAALLGTPSIVISQFGRIHVNEYVAKKGFPLFTAKPTSVVEYAKRLLDRKFNVKAKLAALENPVDFIENALLGKRVF